MLKTKEEVVSALQNAKTSGGYAHTITEVQCDLEGTPTRIAGTITIPATTGLQARPSEIINILWSLKGIAEGANRKLDLITV